MSTPNVIWGSEGDQFFASATKSLPFGTRMKFVDGREFVYSRVGSTTDLTAGALQQQAVVGTGHIIDLAIGADAAIGATSIEVTNATTTITANMYDEGYLFTNDAAGEGYLYKIKSHEAGVSDASDCTVVLEEGSALRVALTTSSKVGLRKHYCDGAIIAPTTETGVLIGVSLRAVTKAYYCWLQVKGSAAVLTNSTVVVGEGVTRSLTTEGAIDAYDENGTSNLAMIGTVQSVGATEEYSLVYLDIK